VFHTNSVGMFMISIPNIISFLQWFSSYHTQTENNYKYHMATILLFCIYQNIMLTKVCIFKDLSPCNILGSYTNSSSLSPTSKFGWLSCW